MPSFDVSVQFDTYHDFEQVVEMFGDARGTDATIGVSNGEFYADFTVEADTYEQAVEQATNRVVELGFEVIRVKEVCD